MMLSSASLKRVLHIVSSMDRGGAETLLMNVYRNVDLSKIQFDFVTHGKKHCDYEDEILKLGGKLYKIDSLGSLGPVRYVRTLMTIMKENRYQAVHSHTDFQGGFVTLAAILCGIQERISHSHSNHWSKKKSIISEASLHFLKILIKCTATNYCACSKEAAVFLFGKKSFLSGRVHILKNGIEVLEYTAKKIDSDVNIKEELAIPFEAKIIGHIGRFSESKNHLFILTILKKILEKNPNIYVVLVGDGPLKGMIEQEALNLGISKHVKFLGVRSDIPSLLKSFDVFLFPSLYEGFGMVLLEAQCAGVPCVISDTVPKTTDMDLNLATYLNLHDDNYMWTREILNAFLKEKPGKEIILSNFSKKGYSISENVNEWLSLYNMS